MTEDDYKEAVKKSRKKNLEKAIQAFIDESIDEDIGVITLEVNYHHYNMGYKIKKTKRSPLEI